MLAKIQKLLRLLVFARLRNTLRSFQNNCVEIRFVIVHSRVNNVHVLY